MLPVESDESLAIPLNLRDHKASIAIFWSVMVCSNSAVPLALYFGMRYHTSLSLDIIISITTAITGVPPLWSWFWRSCKQVTNENLRPVGVRNRWAFDTLGWNLHVGVAYLSALLVCACTFPPYVRLFSLMLPLIMVQVCLQLLLVEICYKFGWRTPFRISSVPAGSAFPPGVVVVAEDACAVDGRLGRDFRRALHRRIAVSRPINHAVRCLDWLWGSSGLMIGGAIVIVIFVVENAECGLIVGKTPHTLMRSIILTEYFSFLSFFFFSIPSPLGLGRGHDIVYHICD